MQTSNGPSLISHQRSWTCASGCLEQRAAYNDSKRKLATDTLGHEHGLEDLVGDVSHCSRSVWQEERVGFVAFADGLERVEVLRHQNKLHDFARGRAFDCLLELLDRGLEAFDNGAALVGNSLPLQCLAFGFGLGFLDDKNLVGFTASAGGDLFALSGVDVVHGGLDLGVRHDIGDENVDDLVAECSHVGVEFLLDGGSDAGLRCEDLVESHAGNVPEDDLLNIGLDLRHGIGEAIVGVVDFLGPHAILYRNWNGDKDVVFGLGLHGERDLVDAQTDDSRNGIEVRDFPVEPRIGSAEELAEARNDG